MDEWMDGQKIKCSIDCFHRGLQHAGFNREKGCLGVISLLLVVDSADGREWLLAAGG